MLIAHVPESFVAGILLQGTSLAEVGQVGEVGFIELGSLGLVEVPLALAFLHSS